MERIENPMVLGHTPYDEKPLEECECCGCDLFHGDKYIKIGSTYYCEDCAETGTLDEADYEPDWDSMPGGYDDWRD